MCKQHDRIHENGKQDFCASSEAASKAPNNKLVKARIYILGYRQSITVHIAHPDERTILAKQAI